MKFQNPIIESFLLNLTFLVLCLGIGGLHYGCLDDFFMAAIITGAYGGSFDAHTLFVNGVYAFFLKPFYAIFPDVGWYSIFEMLGVFVAFTSATFCLLRKQNNKIRLWVSLVLLACITPAFYLQLGFTQCAAVMTAAGILLVYVGYDEKKKLSLLFGSILLVCGMVFRREGFLLGVPFLFLLLAVSTIKRKDVYKWIIVALLACFAAYQGLQSFNQHLFDENSEYSYYQAYQGPRAMLGDGAYYDSKTVYDELEERGMPGRDLNLLERWVFYDTEVFCLDSLRPVVDVINRNRYEMNYAKLPAQLFFVLANSFWGTNAWCWCIFCLLLFLGQSKKANVYVWGTLVLIALCLTFLLLQNRVVGHVENSIWLYATFCAIPFVAGVQFDELKLKNILGLLGMLAVACFVLAYKNLPKIENDRLLFGLPRKSDDLESIVQVMESHPENVYLLPFNSYKEYAFFYGNILTATSPRSLGNMIPLGYWNINHPGMIKELSDRGVQNPLRDIVKENVFVVDEKYKLRLEEFYARHYSTKLVVDTIVKFGSKSLLKYKQTDGKEGAEHE